MAKEKMLSKGSKGAYLSFNRPTFESQKGVFKVSREVYIESKWDEKYLQLLIEFT